MLLRELDLEEVGAGAHSEQLDYVLVAVAEVQAEVHLSSNV